MMFSTTQYNYRYHHICCCHRYQCHFWKIVSMQFCFLFIDTNECESLSCNGNGECKDRINSYICDCFDGYEGDTCGIGKINLFITQVDQ